MRVFEFFWKEQTNVFSIFTTVALSIGVLLFFDWQNLTLHASTAFFIVSLFSFISLRRSVKKASKTFIKIIVDENKVNLYFANKMKDKITLNIDQFSVVEQHDFIEVKDNDGNSIGKAYKNRIKIEEEWEVLIGFLKKNFTVQD